MFIRSRESGTIAKLNRMTKEIVCNVAAIECRGKARPSGGDTFPRAKHSMIDGVYEIGAT